MRYLPIVAATVILAVSACAAQQPPMKAVWSPQGTPTLPQSQALAECRYDAMKDPNNFDRLFLLSGQPAMRADGSIQGLSQHGMGMFQLCMQAKGYVVSGAEPATNTP
jgi:hypothetical protein